MFIKKSDVDKWLAAELDAEYQLELAAQYEKTGQFKKAEHHYKKAEKRDQEAQRYA